MKTMYVVAGLTAFLVAGIVFAQSDSDYQAWMKSNGAAMASLQKNVAAKDGNGVAADAKTLEGNLKQVEAFWTKRGGAPDAVNFAKMGQMAAATLAKDATGNMDAVAADVKSLQGNCGGCHMAHREKTEAGFKFK
jgi:cytochrome c556